MIDLEAHGLTSGTSIRCVQAWDQAKYLM